MKISLSFGTAGVQPPSPETIIETAEGEIFPTGEVMVRLQDGLTIDDANNIAASVGGYVIGVVPGIETFQLRVAATTDVELQGAISTLESDSRVVHTLRNYLGTYSTLFNDTVNLGVCHP